MLATAVVRKLQIIGKSGAHMSKNSVQVDVCQKFKGAARSWAHSDCRVLACKNKEEVGRAQSLFTAPA
jgi:hypothetical protein